jgi:hypothetical protein
MAASGNAGVFAGESDVLKRNAACLLLIDCFGDDHGGHMRWQVHDCSSSTSRKATRTSARNVPWLWQHSYRPEHIGRPCDHGVGRVVSDEGSSRH